MNLPWEDNLLERKVESDLKDLLKTLVGFANSVKPGHIATILIGERNDGSIAGVTNPDNIQKTIRNECDKIYPPIIWRSKVYEKEGEKCVKIEVEFSGETPHFGGPAWIRRGSETVKATDDLFQKLVNLRNGKVFELGKWVGKEVTIHADQSHIPPLLINEYGTPAGRQKKFVYKHRWPKEESCVKLISVNNFWATFLKTDTNTNHSEPLEKITLTFDDVNNRLKIIVYY